MRTDKLESKNFILECLGPLHIGGGADSKLSQYQYLYNQAERQVYFVDEHKFANLLMNKGLFEEFFKYLAQAMTVKLPMKQTSIEELRQRFSGTTKKPETVKQAKNTYEWLKLNGVSKAQILGITIGIAAAPEAIKNKDDNNLNDVQRCICTADGRPYIPGSSIKGALMTGVTAEQIQCNKREYAQHWQRMKAIPATAQSIYEIKKQLGRLMMDISSQALKKLEYGNNYALNSVARGICVSDAMPCGAMETIVLKKIDASTKMKKTGSNEQELPLFRECIQPGSQFQFSITIDKDILELIGYGSIEDLLKTQRNFIHAVYTLQEGVFGKQYPQTLAAMTSADLILGGGVGFLNKTLIHALAPNSTAANEFIKKLLDRLFIVHKHIILDTQIAPRTLKLTVLNSKKQLLGLCKISEVE